MTDPVRGSRLVTFSERTYTEPELPPPPPKATSSWKVVTDTIKRHDQVTALEQMRQLALADQKKREAPK